ncbi:MAG: hypothetical protein ACLT9P_10695 [Evtepia gabavorous]
MAEALVSVAVVQAAWAVAAADAQADVRGHVPHPAKVVDVRLSPAGNGRHGLHRLHRVPASGGLPGEHDGGGAVIDSVGHVGDLRPGGPGVLAIMVQHLVWR